MPTLDGREAEVIRMVTMGEETLAGCGRELGLSRERVRQIEVKALWKLRHPSRSKYLKPFLVTTVPKNRVHNEKPSTKFVYDTPGLRPVPCEHIHGKNFEVKIYESDGYVIWVEGQGNGGCVNGKEFRLCNREQATHYRYVANARKVAALLDTDAVLVDSRILIPERITAGYSLRSTLLSVCKVHGADTYVVQCRVWGAVHYLRDDGKTAGAWKVLTSSPPKRLRSTSLIPYVQRNSGEGGPPGLEAGAAAPAQIVSLRRSNASNPD